MNAMICPRCGEAVPAEPTPPTLRCSAEVYELLGRSLARSRQERFYCVSLDSRNRVMRRHLVAVGSLASVAVHPREVFAPVIRDRAAALVILHNHPSGDVNPSPEDLDITHRLVEAGRILGVPLLDHIIVGRNGYCSLRDVGRLGTGCSNLPGA